MHKPTCSLLIAAIAGAFISLAPAAQVQAQVLTDGVPSAAAGFDTVLNLPADAMPGGTEIGDMTGAQLTQINVSGTAHFDLAGSPDFVHFTEFNLFDTSTSGNGLDFFNSEVNIISGSLGSIADIEVSSSLNMSGGAIGSNLDIYGTANISGGTIGNTVDTKDGSNVIISGGSFSGVEFFGVADISGGTFGTVDFESTSNVTVSDGTFGSNFDVFGVADISGGVFGNNFDASNGSDVTISGGTFGTFDAENGSAVDISGGNFDNFLNDGTVNISGGTFLASDIFRSSGDTNFTGIEFFIDGIAVTGSSFNAIEGAKLTGLLSDGSSIDFDLFSIDPLDNSTDFFSGGLTAGGTTINITAIPEPGSLAILALGGLGLLARRRRLVG